MKYHELVYHSMPMSHVSSAGDAEHGHVARQRGQPYYPVVVPAIGARSVAQPFVKPFPARDRVPAGPGDAIRSTKAVCEILFGSGHTCLTCPSVSAF